MDVIAEGVETKEQEQFLLQEGCRYVQGFLYGHPMAATQMEEILLAQAARQRTADGTG